MNNARRKALRGISVKLGEITSAILRLRDEEQDYIDNMPESLQSSKKYDNAEAAVTLMDDAINDIETSCSSLDEAIDR